MEEKSARKEIENEETCQKMENMKIEPKENISVSSTGWLCRSSKTLCSVLSFGPESVHVFKNRRMTIFFRLLRFMSIKGKTMCFE